MTELEKLVQTWEKHKPTGTPHERIWNGFINDAKTAIEREKQALSIANDVGRSEQLVSFLRQYQKSCEIMHVNKIDAKNFVEQYKAN